MAFIKTIYIIHGWISGSTIFKTKTNGK